MKKVLLIIVFGLVFLGLKAQTKDETILWLNQKFSNFGKVYYSFGRTTYDQSSISIDDENLVVSVIINDLNNETHNMTYTVSIASISKWDWTGCYSCTNLNQIQIYSKGQVVKAKDAETGTNYTSSFYLSLSWEGDSNLKNRFEKAFNNLLSFYKTKEAF